MRMVRTFLGLGGSAVGNKGIRILFGVLRGKPPGGRRQALCAGRAQTRAGRGLQDQKTRRPNERRESMP
jgi:hypothetical protein